MIYRATVEAPCASHGPHAVTITGDGEQVWEAAAFVTRVIEENGGTTVMHFYVNGKEVDCKDAMSDINAELTLLDALKKVGRVIALDDLPF